MTDDSQDSILNNLNKTRELWSSKSDNFTGSELLRNSASPNKDSVPMDSVSMNNHVEIISSEEPLVEDFDLPDIQGIKSQWESPVQVGVPLPSHKSPAALAREREIQERQRAKMEQQAPVNREDVETEPEKYDVEMNKLKAQFEKGSKSSGAKSNNTSRRKSSLKDSGSRRRSSSCDSRMQGQGNSQTSKAKKQLRFNTKVEVAVVDTSSTIPLTSAPVVNGGGGGEIISYEQQIEEEPIRIDLKNLKSQFERGKAATTTTPTPKSRSKKHATTPTTPNVVVPIPASPIVTSPRRQEPGDPPIEVIRSGDVVEDINYEVEMTSLRKMFDKTSTNSNTTKKEPKKTKRRTFSSSSATSSTTSSSISHTSSLQQKPTKVEEMKNEETVEVVKSSEPLHEEMIGEESVKDRLARYKEIANFKEAAKTPKKKAIRTKQFSASKPLLSSTGDSQPTSPTQSKPVSAESSTPEIIRSTTAGSKEEANYELSVDLKQTKALFESASSSSNVSRTSTRRSSFKTRRSSSASRSVSPTRSSRSSSAHSYTLKSRDDSDIADTPSDMAEIVRPSPAGTKEVVDVQPSFSISAAKSLFESSKTDKSDVDYSSPRRRQLKSDWAVANANKEVSVVKEGSYIENNGVVRPPSAGTKEKPDYQLESNALKARAAIFQQGKANEYKPRNRVQKEEKKVAAEIVNRNDDSTPAAEEEFVPSIDQKAARSVFENQQEEKVSAPRTVNDVVRASNMNAAKGVFTGEVQAANQESSSSSSSSEDEQEEAQEEEEAVEEVEEVAAVPAEPPVAAAATFEIEPIVEPVAPEPAVEEKEVEQNTPAVVDVADTNSSSSSESSVSEEDSVEQAALVTDVQATEQEQLQNEGKIGGPDSLGDFFSPSSAPQATNNNEQFSNFDLDTSSMFPVQSDTTLTGDTEPATIADLDMGGDDPFGMNQQQTMNNNPPQPSNDGGFGNLDIFASPPPNTPANPNTTTTPASDPFAAFSTTQGGSDPFSLESSKPVSSDPFSMGAAIEPSAGAPPASADPFDLFGSMSQPPAANNNAAPAAAGKDPFDLFG